jgi:hypothetical protein
MDIKETIPLIVTIGGAVWGIYKGIVILIARRKKQLVNAKNQGKAEAQEEIIDEQRYKELKDEICELSNQLKNVSIEYRNEIKSFEEKLLLLSGKIIDPKIILEFIERNTRYATEIEILKGRVRNIEEIIYKSNRNN